MAITQQGLQRITADLIAARRRTPRVIEEARHAIRSVEKRLADLEKAAICPHANLNRISVEIITCRDCGYEWID